MKKGFLKLLFLFLVSLTICQAQDAGSPQISAVQPNPSGENGATPPKPVTDVRNSWALFHDPTLDALIDQGLSNNPDIRVAVSRVEEARIRVRVAQSYLSPSIRSSLVFSTQSLSSYRPVQVPTTVDMLPRVQYNIFQVLPIDASYEVDLFQRIRGNIRTTEIQRLVTESDVQITQLTVASEIARIYYLIRANDNEQGVIRRNLNLRDSTLSIIRARFRAGLTNEIDARRAETDIVNVRVQLQGLERSRAELVNGLATVCGQNPATFTLAPTPVNVVVPELPFATITLDQLRRRPDLIQAEQLAQVANLQIQISRTALYPRLNIVGSAGTLTGHIGTIGFGASLTYLFGVSASVPIYEGKRNRQNITLAQQQTQTAQATIQQRVLTAQREAETALDNLQLVQQQIVTQEQGIVSARQTEVLNRGLYTQGLTTFLEVLDAQRTVLESERQLVLLQSQRATYTVALYKALGGAL